MCTLHPKNSDCIEILVSIITICKDFQNTFTCYCYFSVNISEVQVQQWH